MPNPNPETQTPVREGAETHEKAPERTQKVLREYYRRNLKTAGTTISIVIDEENLTLEEPVEKVRSRTGSHGEDIYIINKPVLVLRYTRSNSGKARWSIYEITPTAERKLKYRDLPALFRNAIKEHARYHGIKLYEWEEEEGDEDG